MSEEITFYDVRFACATCGWFISEAAIRSQDFRDDSYYYGIRTETEYDCKRCGTLQGDPPIVTVREIRMETAS